MNHCGALLGILLIGSAAHLSGCRPEQKSPQVGLLPPFSFTNVVLNDNSSAWILHQSNGPSVELGRRRITIYFEPESTMTLDFEPATMKLNKVILETPPSSRQTGQWVSDFNADGVPEVRKFKSKQGNEVFYEGKWYPSKPAGGTNTLITVEGKEMPVFYNGDGWRAHKE
jgi:hypothetical protein